MLRRPLIAIAAVALLSACGSSLESDDPQGYEACRLFDRSVGMQGDVDGLGVQLAAGKAASKAKTDTIRSSVKSLADDIENAPATLEDTYLVDRGKMREACAGEGYEFKN